MDGIKIKGPQTREATITRKRPKNRTVELSFASDTPVDRGIGREILVISPGAVRLDRLRKEGAAICDHDPRDVVGTVEDVWLDGNKVRARVRFGNSPRAAEIFRDVKEGIRTGVSFGYHVHKYEEGDTPDVYRVTDWEPLEISFTAIPADITVGVGRSLEMTRQSPAERKHKMEKNENTGHGSESHRVSEILAIGERAGRMEMAVKAVREGTDLEQFRAAVLDTFEAVSIDDSSLDYNSGGLGLSNRDLGRFSVLRAIDAMANPNDRRIQEAAGFEREVSKAASRAMGKEPQGFVVPNEVLQRDFVYGGGSGVGSGLVGTDHRGDSFVDLLRAKTWAIQRGTVLSGLVGNQSIPVQTAGATAGWGGENVPVSEQTQTVDQLALEPKTVGCYTNISRRMIKQGSPDAERFVMGDLASAVGGAIDQAAINGPGGVAPLGILGTTGIAIVAIAENGGAVDFNHIVDLESAVANQNADAGALGYLTNTKVRGALKKKEVASGTGIFAWSGGNTKEGIGQVNGYLAHVSNNVPDDLTKGIGNNLSACIFGNFADLIVGMWGGLEIIADPYTRATDGTVKVTALQDVDIVVRRAESFAAMVDIIAG